MPSRLVWSMDESPLIECFFWSMDESPLIDCAAAGSFEIVVSCPVFKAILLPYRLTSFQVSERLKRPLAIPMCTVPYRSILKLFVTGGANEGWPPIGCACSLVRLN